MPGLARRVILLSATTGYQLRSFGDAAERVGVELIFGTDRCHQLDDPWRDRAVAVRFHDEESSLDAIVRAVAHAPVRGVLAVGDRPTVLAARIAERFGLPGNPADAVAASGNKRATRERFAACGLNTPANITLPLSADFDEAFRDSRLTFPCVLKPLGLSGSRGVIRADNADEFKQAFARIRSLLSRPDVRAARTGLEDAVLVEQFIPGREFAIEGVLTNGGLQTFAIFDKPDPLDGPFFEETIYVTPSALSANAQATILTSIARATEALGLRHGPVHAECRVGPDGIFVLEIAARPIGGLCSKTLRFDGGVSLEEVLLRHAIGEDVAGFRQDAEASAVMMIPIPRRGLLKAVRGEDDARSVPGIDDVRITAKIGQLLEPLPEAGSYLGFIFARSGSAGAAGAAVREAHRRLVFEIDPAISVVTATA